MRGGGIGSRQRGRYEAEFDGFDNCMSSIPRIELPSEVEQVGVDGRRGDEEFGGDICIRQACRQEGEYLNLSRRQMRRPVGCSCCPCSGGCENSP